MDKSQNKEHQSDPLLSALDEQLHRLDENLEKNSREIKELAELFDKALRTGRLENLKEGLLRSSPKLEESANKALEEWKNDYLEHGPPPPGLEYKSIRLVLGLILFHETWVRSSDKLAAEFRAGFMKASLEEAGYSTNAFIALERAIISDHERRKVEKRHQNSIKANFQQDAIQKWQATNGKKTKVQFSIQYRDELKAKHGIDIDYRSIQEVWLKGY